MRRMKKIGKNELIVLLCTNIQTKYGLKYYSANKLNKSIKASTFF